MSMDETRIIGRTCIVASTIMEEDGMAIRVALFTTAVFTTLSLASATFGGIL